MQNVQKIAKDEMTAMLARLDIVESNLPCFEANAAELDRFRARLSKVETSGAFSGGVASMEDIERLTRDIAD